MPVRAVGSSWSGSGSCSRIPLTAGSPLRPFKLLRDRLEGGLPSEPAVERLDPHLAAGPLLGLDVDRRRRVAADEHRRESWTAGPWRSMKAAV